MQVLVLNHALQLQAAAHPDRVARCPPTPRPHGAVHAGALPSAAWDQHLGLVNTEFRGYAGEERVYNVKEPLQVGRCPAQGYRSRGPVLGGHNGAKALRPGALQEQPVQAVQLKLEQGWAQRAALLDAAARLDAVAPH